MKKILILLFFVLSSCGYQPIYSVKGSNNFVFKKIELIGDKRINRLVLSIMDIKENKKEFSHEKIILKNDKKIIETSKDSKGKPDSFKMILSLEMIIENNGKIIKKNEIIKEFGYKNLENKFNLSQYENDLENNLINEIVDELIILFSL